jgi:hypothetical protein
MNRDDLIEAGAQAICAQYTPAAVPEDRLREDVGVVVDAVEPLIRADVRELGAALNAALLRDLRTRLSVGVAALQTYPPVLFSGNARVAWVEACAEVLNLIDESRDT